MIKTQRLTLIPLTMQNLETGLGSIRQLSTDLNIPIVADLMEGASAEAIHKKLEIMGGLTPALHKWCTYWLIVLECDNVAMGLVGFKGVPDEQGAVEIGYGIDSIYQGRGYMTEAVEALVDWAFAQPECRLVNAFTHPDNIASRKVLLKNGFVEMGTDGEEIRYQKVCT
jgi:ribosomal-protein-alanine N-acetyltransferase